MAIQGQSIRAFVAGAILLTSSATAPSESSAQSNPPATRTAPPPSGFFESEGLKIHYESFGAGPPLVLVPGWGSGTQRNWIATGWIDVLKAKHLVISVEPRGTGKSDKPHRASAYSYSVMSRDVLALMNISALARRITSVIRWVRSWAPICWGITRTNSIR
jgi:hypothetical protein